MSFFERLEKLRAKPEDERKRLALILTVVASALVVLIWVVNLGVTLTTVNSNQVAQLTPPSPFSQLGGVAASNLITVKDGFVTVVTGLIDLFR